MDTQRMRRFRGDEGAVIVEAAFAMPLVLTLLMGLIDFAFVELKTSQLSSAARDGARKGIVLDYATGTTAGSTTGGASCPNNTNFGTICDSVKARLAGTSIDSVLVECRSGLTTTVKTCSTAVRGVDSLYVAVSLVHNPLTIVGQTFLGTTKTYNASAQMLL